MSTIVIGVEDSTHSEDAGALARRATGDVLMACIHVMHRTTTRANVLRPTPCAA